MYSLSRYNANNQRNQIQSNRQPRVNLPLVFDSDGNPVSSNRQFVVHLVNASPTGNVFPDFIAHSPNGWSPLSSTAAMLIDWTEMSGPNSSPYFNSSTGIYTVQQDDNGDTFTITANAQVNQQVPFTGVTPTIQIYRNGTVIGAQPFKTTGSGNSSYVTTQEIEAVVENILNAGDEIWLGISGANSNIVNAIAQQLKNQNTTFEMKH